MKCKEIKLTSLNLSSKHDFAGVTGPLHMQGVGKQIIIMQSVKLNLLALLQLQIPRVG